MLKKLLGYGFDLLGSAVGPLGSIATNLVKDALGVSSEEEIERRLAEASPETLAALREAENKFRLQVEQLANDRLRLAAEDRQSAREREIAIQDPYVKWMGIGILSSIIIFLGLMFAIDVPESNVQLVTFVLGTLVGWAGSVITYYFGSSEGSKEKQSLLGRILGRPDA